jgi:hypothetical protein
VNTQRGHIRGHQDISGRLLSTGPYRSAGNFTEKNFKEDWQLMLDTNLENAQMQMQRMRTGEIVMEEEETAEKLHLQRLDEFYSNLGDLSVYVNHSACFCCLRELPEHPLPCGHVLCTPCIKSFAFKKNTVTYAIGRCPLHQHQTWEPPWEIAVKPDLASCISPYLSFRKLILTVAVFGESWNFKCLLKSNNIWVNCQSQTSLI